MIIQVVFFDAVGTLFQVKGSVGEIYLRYAKKYGIRLEPEFYKKYNPIPTRKDAEELEEYVAIKLRQERYGVWSN